VGEHDAQRGKGRRDTVDEHWICLVVSDWLRMVDVVDHERNERHEALATHLRHFRQGLDVFGSEVRDGPPRRCRAGCVSPVIAANG
jgi:hypothetical protein